MFNIFKKNESNENVESINECLIDESSSLDVRFDYSYLKNIILSNETLNIIGDEVFMYNWYRKDGEWIEKDSPLYLISGPKGYGFGYIEPIYAIRSGILEIIISNGKINNLDIVCVIHPIGAYKNENILDNDPYCFYFDAFKKPFNVFKFCKPFNIPALRFEKINWKKKSLDFVNLNDLIFTFEYLGNDKFLPISHYSEKEGYLYISESHERCGWPNMTEKDLLYKIYSNYDELLKMKYINSPKITFDEFTNKKSIQWKMVAMNSGYSTGITSYSNDNSITFTFTFNNFDNKDFIVFQFSSKEIMLSKGDTISFLFSDNKIIDFTIDTVSYKISHPNIDKQFENKLQITLEELHHFEINKFIKWKITIKKQNREIIGGENGINQYKSHDNLVTAIQKFTNEYKALVSAEITDYKPLLQREAITMLSEIPLAKECYVYLMIDTINHYHKIGISNKPTWREKTLQSEKPTIELLASKRFINRKIASSFEKALHETYSHKRIRGEWFNLDLNEVNEIVKTLND
jgi:hypothetical protein